MDPDEQAIILSLDANLISATIDVKVVPFFVVPIEKVALLTLIK